MGRSARVDAAGHAYHVLNRAVGRTRIFRTDGDFAAFEQVLAEAVAHHAGKLDLLAYCIMGNHWHLVVRTRRDGVLSAFMQWLTLTHTQRYRAAHGTVGYGPIYQGRFKSFVIERDRRLLTVCRYVESNAVRAGLLGPKGRAEDWPWSSLWRWRHPGERADEPAPLVLAPWPLPRDTAAAGDGSGRPRQWLRTVNTPLSGAELEALRTAAHRGQPWGSEAWRQRMIRAWGLESTTRRPGRPRQPRPA